MDQFTKENFHYSNGYLSYQGQFVARFKHQVRDRTGFQSFLIRKFSPSEYFARLKNRETPMEILESKGYVSYTIKRLLTLNGFEPTLAGKQEYLASIIK